MAMCAVLVSSLASLAFPTAVGKVIDVVSTHGTVHNFFHMVFFSSFFFFFIFAVHVGSADDVQFIVLGMLGLVCGGALAVFVRVSLLGIVSERVARQLRKQVFQCMIHQNMAFFDQNDTGRLVNRLSTDTSMVASTLTDNVARTLKSGVVSTVDYICFFFFPLNKFQII